MSSIEERKSQVDILFQSIKHNLPDTEVSILLVVNHDSDNYVWLYQSNKVTFSKIDQTVLQQTYGQLSAVQLSLSFSTLNAIMEGSLTPGIAYITRRVVFKGDRAQLMPYTQNLRAALTQTASYLQQKGTSHSAALSSFLAQQERKQQRKKGVPTNSLKPPPAFIHRASAEWESSTLVQRCRCCEQSFTFWTRKHHCRVCGRVVCNSCSLQAIRQQRVCDQCYEEVKQTEQKPVSFEEDASYTAETENGQERFLKALFEAQRLNISAKSINETTSPIVASLLDMMSELKTYKKFLQGNTKSRHLDSMLQELLSSLLLVAPFGLMWFLLLHATLLSPFTLRHQLCLCFLVVTARGYYYSIAGFLLAIAYEEGLLSLSVTRSAQMLFTLSSEWQVYMMANIIVGGSTTFLSIVLAGITLLFGRLLFIYAVAFSIILSYLFVKIVFINLLKWPDQAVDKIYKRMHRHLAPFACNQVLRLRSVFVKFGQYLGARADVVPPEWNVVLAKLQDDMPADRPSYVTTTLEKQLGCKIDECFHEFQHNPIASASIAQVHEAWLRDKQGRRGPKVAVKIQHESIATIMRSDMKAFQRIVRFAAYLNPRFSSITTILGAWEKEMLKELDFTIEAKNIETVRGHLREMEFVGTADVDIFSHPYSETAEPTSTAANLSYSDSSVILPKVLRNHVTPSILLMSFVEGFKMTDFSMMKLYHVDKQALMERLVQLYGIQMFVYGTFNADPHPGNILIQVDQNSGKVKPVLLDFGMVISLPEKERLGYCKLLYSISQLSINGVAKAIRQIGYQNSQSHIYPERDLEFFAYMLRPTASRSNSMVASKQFRKRRKAQRRADLSQTKDGQNDLEETDDSIAEGRYFKDFPESLIFLFRVLGLIRGLCAQLDVEVNYIEIMAKYARYALIKERERLMSQQRKLSIMNLGPASQLSPSTDQLSRKRELARFVFRGVEEALSQQLRREIAESPTALGIQVSCIVNNQPVIDLAEGMLSPFSSMEVTSSSLFPLIELSHMLLNCGILLLVSQGRTTFETTVSSLWSVFPLPDLTIGDLLTRSGALEEVISLTSSVSRLVDRDEMEHAIIHGLGKKVGSRASGTSHEPMQMATSTLYTAAIILTKVIEIVSRKPIEDFVRKDLIACTLNSNQQGQTEICTRRGLLDKPVAEVQAGYATFILNTVMGSLFSAQSHRVETPAYEAAEDSATPATSEQSLSESLMSMNLNGIPLDPLLVNGEELADQYLPALGCFASARGVTSFLQEFFTSTLRESLLLRLLKQPVAHESSRFFGPRNWTYGFEMKDLGTELADRVLFLQGFGGNFILICPSRNLFLTILVNNLSLERGMTSSCVAKVLETIGITSGKELFNGMF